MAIAAGATFVARAYASNIPQLTDLMIQAEQHPGFAVVDILQPCVTWNKQYTHLFFQENIYNLDASHNTSDKDAAFKKAGEWGLKQIPIGVFYKNDKEPSYESLILQIKDKPLIEHSPEGRDLAELFKKFT